MLIIIYKFFGIRIRHALKRYKDGWIDLKHDAYVCGYLPPRYPVPATIGRVSLGQDYKGIWFIDDADADDPVMVWAFDTWWTHNPILTKMLGG